MSKKGILGKELKGLGHEMANALSEVKSSKQLKTLQKDLSKAFQLISKSLSQSLQSAQKSQSAKRIKRRVKQVIKAGAEEGKIEAQKIHGAAIKGLQQAKVTLSQLVEKLKKD